VLTTHVTASEIGAQLFMSLHTIKSQQASLYHKLGAATRSQAVAQARQLGLLEG
jgi:LuxR family maltose regulon positive regulatory protein